jgi:predicted dehydrogenase
MKFVSEQNPIRIALVGAGRIGLTHLEAIDLVDEAVVAAVVESRAPSGQAIAEQRQIPWFSDYQDPSLLDLVDAVVIASPPNTHYAISRHFLENGVHVLCEKPLTLNVTDAKDLVAVARETDLLLMMASKFRYVDDLIKAKSIIEAGLLGRIVLFENTFCGKALMKDRWNARVEVSGGGVLIDNGTHSVDIARYLLGPIQAVQALNGMAAQGLEVEDTARLQFRTMGGVIGMIDLSWSINKDTDSYVSVFGLEGTLVVGWKGSRYRQDGNAQWVRFGGGYDKVRSLAKQAENFVSTLRGREMPLITPQDALASVEVIEAAYSSTKRDNWTPVGAA